MAMDAAAKTFFSSKYFAVAVLEWYHARALPVTPLNPARPSIDVQNTTYSTVVSPAKLEHPTDTSLSVITQPSITKQILKEAKEAGVPAVWLQPGSFDEEVLALAKEFKAGIGGFEGGTMGGEGWCVLVDGDRLLNAAKRDAESSRKL